MRPAGSAPHVSGGPAPVRRPYSVRRTSTIETSWPEGWPGPMHMVGNARDTWQAEMGHNGPGKVLASGWCRIVASPARQILSLEVEPPIPAAAQLVGVRAGGQSRAAINAHFPPSERTTPLHLLLDDFAGASLVAGWAWSQWREKWGQEVRASQQVLSGKAWVMEGVCAGFRPGASSLNPDGTARQDIQSNAPVVSLIHPDDPDGWHTFSEQQGVGARRARWIDVWQDGTDVCTSAGFQDSATRPDGGRQAVHEYRVHARADKAGLCLKAIEADPRVLPYQECPAAAGNISRLIGMPLADMRRIVLEQLPGTLGCTHLNDILRGLADVPALFHQLETRS